MVSRSPLGSLRYLANARHAASPYRAPSWSLLLPQNAQHSVRTYSGGFRNRPLRSECTTARESARRGARWPPPSYRFPQCPIPVRLSICPSITDARRSTNLPPHVNLHEAAIIPIIDSASHPERGRFDESRDCKEKTTATKTLAEIIPMEPTTSAGFANPGSSAACAA